MDNYIPPEALIVTLLGVISRQQTQTRPTRRQARKLRLSTIKSARNSVKRIIREFDADPKADPTRLKAMIYAFNILLAYFDRDPPPARIESAKPSESDPNLQKLTPDERKEFDRLWLKAVGISPLAEA